METQTTPTTSKLNESNYSQVSLSPSPAPALVCEASLGPSTSVSTIALTTDTSDTQPAILTGSSHLPTPDDQQSAVLPYYYPRLEFENVNDYFCHRNGLIEAAVRECVSTLVFPSEDGPVVGSWLLTEISFWDNEKERIVILTKKAIMIIKYDFIALKKMEFKRIPLFQIDTIVIGDLVYPKASIVPHLNGIATGVSTAIQQCVVSQLSPATNKNASTSYAENESSTNKIFDVDNFKSRDRNMKGARIMWNRGVPLPFMKKWNPFDNKIPFSTFTFHPLFYHKDTHNKHLYDIDVFANNLVTLIEEVQNENVKCDINYASIVLPTYVGLTSFIHNKTSLGFFKVRGKFSF